MTALAFEVLLTHSSRPVDMAQCASEALRRRYADPDRLGKIPPLESLSPVAAARSYEGGVSLMRIELSGADVRLEDLGFREIGQKIQHAAFVGARVVLTLEDAILWVDGFDSIPKACPGKGDPRRLDDPWFAGLHTCFPIDETRALASASAPDAFFWIDLEAGRVDRRLRLPETLYGRNYHLDEHTSLTEHYIGNDQQIAHMNCAFPCGDGSVVYSTLIQGHFGRFSDAAGWRVHRSGNVGCHGARATGEGMFYFADSTKGELVMFDRESGDERRIHRPSIWLHDVQQLPGTPFFLCTEADRNAVTLVDGRTGDVILDRAWADRGQSTQFLHARRCD